MKISKIHEQKKNVLSFEIFPPKKDEELKNIEISTLTPLDALNTLYRLQNKLNNRWKSE